MSTLRKVKKAIMKEWERSLLILMGSICLLASVPWLRSAFDNWGFDRGPHVSHAQIPDRFRNWHEETPIAVSGRLDGMFAPNVRFINQTVASNDHRIDQNDQTDETGQTDQTDQTETTDPCDPAPPPPKKTVLFYHGFLRSEQGERAFVSYTAKTKTICRPVQKDTVFDDLKVVAFGADYLLVSDRHNAGSTLRVQKGEYLELR